MRDVETRAAATLAGMVEIIHLNVEPITTPEHPDPALIPRHICLDGRHTRILQLEAAAWILLDSIAHEQGITLDELCSDIAEVTAPAATFAQAARCYIIGHLAEEIPDDELSPELRGLKRRGYTRSVQ